MKTIKIKDYYGIYQEILSAMSCTKNGVRCRTKLSVFIERKYITATGPRWMIWRKCRSTLRLTSLRTL